MTLRFRYKLQKIKKPAWTLGGRQNRPRPILFVSVMGPAGLQPQEGLVDTAADDTVFPERLAAHIGVDLTNAPVGEAGGVGARVALLRYAEVVLRISDGREHREWPARVGFTAAPLKHPLLGFAGFLQFFSSNFHGDREEFELTINSIYPGT